MILNSKHDGFSGAFGDDEYVPYDPSATTTGPDNYVETQPTATEPTTPTTYDSETGIPWRDEQATSSGGTESATLNSGQEACPSGNYSECSQTYAKKYGGNSSDYMAMFQSGKTTVSDAYNLFNGTGSGSHPNESTAWTPVSMKAKSGIDNCGLPMSKYICKSTETCVACMNRAQAGGYLGSAYTGPAVDENQPIATTSQPTQKPAVMPSALASRLAGAERKAAVVGYRLEKNAPPSGSGGGGGFGILLALGAAYMAFRK